MMVDVDFSLHSIQRDNTVREALVEFFQACQDSSGGISVTDVNGQHVRRYVVVVMISSQSFQRSREEVFVRKYTAICFAESALEEGILAMVAQADPLNTRQ
jgi:hypothetical protein